MLQKGKKKMKVRKKLSRLLVAFLALILVSSSVFTKGASANAATVNTSTPFNDVKELDWYHDAVMYVYTMGLMNGTGTNTFNPDHLTTRSMIATTFWRMEGSTAVTDANEFSDNTSGAWYFDGVIWASKNKIFEGYGDGTFRPDTPITREQLTATLYRYAQFKNFDTTTIDSLTAFTDHKSISSWAQESMKWAVGMGLITGKTNNILDPQHEATRAEIAAVLQRFIEKSDTVVDTEVDQIDSSATLEKKFMDTSELKNFNYLLYTPDNASDNLPLIIYLHGGSGKGSDLDLLTNTEGFPKYIQDGTIDNIPAYVVIPQLPVSKKGWSDVKTSLKELIDRVSETYHVDRNRISLTGHSMGGTGVWDIAVSLPDLFSGIAPLSGSIKMSESKINVLSKLPVWAFVGSNDTIVDPSSSELFIKRLKTINKNTKITIFDGATHFDVPQLTYIDTNLNLVQWLISNTK